MRSLCVLKHKNREDAVRQPVKTARSTPKGLETLNHQPSKAFARLIAYRTVMAEISISHVGINKRSASSAIFWPASLWLR